MHGKELRGVKRQKSMSLAKKLIHVFFTVHGLTINDAQRCHANMLCNLILHPVHYV